MYFPEKKKNVEFMESNITLKKILIRRT